LLEQERGAIKTPTYTGGVAKRVADILTGAANPQTPAEKTIDRISHVAGHKTPGLWVFVDCRPLSISEAAISNRTIVEGNIFLQDVKEHVARNHRDDRTGRIGFASYKEIPFGAGPMAVVNAARALIVGKGPVIVYLDSHDEVQAELARSLHGVAEMYVRG
jgi:hypothetical protein